MKSFQGIPPLPYIQYPVVGPYINGMDSPF
jgi:hypothetical protein